ncbi:MULTISPECIES: alpha-ribazole phosphatase [Clostridium]|uniref:Alpha-ribazole phosphatase n=1 Tax=Clostridium senegalense TaxID=1465809 RepID=A0A6M0H3G3_9CLOT|nr:MULTISPECIES: alpha-ribazole phosphatase [Clostridium]NEU04778.1 alpha-ribazole phosphatase [Clostridium senegalense]
MNIYLVRHGETKENKDEKFYGDIDNGLTDYGIYQCEKLRNFLKDKKIDKVYVSEKERTIQTAKEILCDKFNYDEIIRDSRLNERNFGAFEGKKYDELKSEYTKECDEWGKDWIGFKPPEGESYKDMYFRVKSFFQKIIKEDDENVLIVAHSGVIRSIYCYIADDNMELFWKFASKNGDVSIIKYEYNNLFIEGIIPNNVL